MKDELSYDRYHENADRIYRVGLEWQFPNNEPIQYIPRTSGLLASTLLNEFPDIEEAVRFLSLDDYGRIYIERGNVRFYEDGGYAAGGSVFKIFSFPLLKGDPETALAEPLSIVLTEPLARRYFGSRNPIGEFLTVQDSLHLKVTGLLYPIPSNSHFSFDFLISLETLPSLFPKVKQDQWLYLVGYTYILLGESASESTIRQEIYDVTGKYNREWESQTGHKFKHFLQPLTDIYLHSNLSYEVGPLSSVVSVYMFFTIAVLIILIACVNFMNLATARSANRVKEVGTRKVLGAFRRQLIYQFLGEAVFITVVALLLAVFLIELALPTFNELAEKKLNLNLFHDRSISIGLIVITLFVGLISGSYPAFALSRFKPVEVLKASSHPRSKGAWIRQGLVIFQFVISIVLIISTAVVYDQLEYMRNQQLGFDKEELVIVKFKGNRIIKARLEPIKTELLKQANVLNASACSYIPGRLYDDIKLEIEGPSGKEPKRLLYQTNDHEYIETFGLSLVAGRDFSREIPTDETEAFILNETAVKYLGWGKPESAIGRQANMGSDFKEGHLIGVVKDFHHASLQHGVEPFLMHINPHWFSYLAIKINAEDIPGTLAALENIWQQLVPDRPFDYFFLDEDYERQYRSEVRLSRIFSIFSILAIMVACLGLFGLISYTAQQRTKEIGIRKVLGATVSNVVILLSKDIVKLAIMANLVAWPVGYLAMDQWLQDFNYRINISLWTFVLGGLLTVVIALITVSFRTINAAMVNPVEALRYE